MSPKRLVLFDIDGTLINGGPLWKEAFIGAMSKFFPDFEFPKVSFSGKTDIQITREMLHNYGYSDAEIESQMRMIIDEYIKRANHALLTRKNEILLLPGVVQLLDELHQHKEVFLGLLTGNVKKGADLKLSASGIHHYFKFGVYGDDHWDRYQLPKIAQNKIQKNHGYEFKGKQIVIIGDTIHDVNCGKSIGVRSIAVGTGKATAREALLSQNPDFYFSDLKATFEVMQAILEDLQE